MDPEQPIFSGKYSFVKQLRKNAYAHVWLAFNHELHENVVIEQLLPAIARDVQKRNWVFEQVQRLQMLDHPAIPWILEARVHEHDIFAFVREFYQGESFRNFILANRPSLEEMLAIIRHIADALTCAHGRYFFHRDISPNSIFVSAHDPPQLLDFDLLHHGQQNPDELTHNFHRIAIKEAAADVYRLAMTTMFAVYGDDLPMGEVLPFPWRFVDRLDCPATIKEVLKRTLKPDHPDRICNARQFQVALRQTNSGTEEMSAHPTRPLQVQLQEHATSGQTHTHKVQSSALSQTQIAIPLSRSQKRRKLALSMLIASNVFAVALAGLYGALSISQNHLANAKKALAIGEFKLTPKLLEATSLSRDTEITTHSEDSETALNSPPIQANEIATPSEDPEIKQPAPPQQIEEIHPPNEEKSITPSKSLTTWPAILRGLEKRIKKSCKKFASGSTYVTLSLSYDPQKVQIHARAQGAHAGTAIGRCAVKVVHEFRFRPIRSSTSTVSLSIRFD